MGYRLMKIPNIKNILNPKSLKWRWFVNVVGLVAVIILVVEIILLTFMYNYYTNSMRSTLGSYINMAVTQLQGYSDKSAAEFENAAQSFANNFSDRQKAEVQIISHDGRIIASSLGVIQDYSYKGCPHKENAVNGTYECEVTHDTEKLFMMTADMLDSDGDIFGSVRMAVSQERTLRQIFYNAVFVIAIGFVVISLIFVTGLYFLRSILTPVKEITNITKTIASGKFDTRIVDKENNQEISELCESINFMASELSHADSVKNEFISSVSHELRTPLTAIKGWSETIKMSGTSDPLILKKGINIILNETARMEGLVEDLLDFSRIESGRMIVNLSKIDILAELEEVVYMYGEVASKLGIGINYDAPEYLPPVNADANRIKQVFINIIDNAIKYSKEGSTVSVEVSVHDVFVRVTVRDMGCGIKKEDLPRIKEKFYKANQTVRGSGIGLAVADEIVRQHNGFIEIDSVEGYGTTVMIELPFIVSNEGE